MLRLGGAPASGRETHWKSGSFGPRFKILGQTTVASELGEGALHHPAPCDDDKGLHAVAPLDDLHEQQGHLYHGSVNLPGVVAAVGPDQFEPREAPADFGENQRGSVAVLDAAEWTMTCIGSPSLSTRAWILRPLIRLPAS